MKVCASQCDSLSKLPLRAAICDFLPSCYDIQPVNEWLMNQKASPSCRLLARCCFPSFRTQFVSPPTSIRCASATEHHTQPHFKLLVLNGIECFEWNPPCKPILFEWIRSQHKFWSKLKTHFSFFAGIQFSIFYARVALQRPVRVVVSFALSAIELNQHHQMYCETSFFYYCYIYLPPFRILALFFRFI